MVKTTLKQKQIADMVRSNTTYINAILCGRRRPSPDLALRIQEATGGVYTVMDLLYPKNRKKVEPSDSGNGSAA
jgi:transcriptional regulator with XRE-family HTH domain